MDMEGFLGINPETDSVVEIQYGGYLEACRLNGFEYVIVGRENYIPIIDYFERRNGTLSLPCRSREDGRNVILGFLSDGVPGRFYIRKMVFPEDGLIEKIKKFVTRYDVVDAKFGEC